MKKDIPFRILRVVQTFNDTEEIVMTQSGNKVMVNITKEFPTPGYGMGVKKITKERNGHRVHLDIKEPAPDSIQLQVVTYKTMTIEIDKNFIGDPPYNFLLEGYNRTLNR